MSRVERLPRGMVEALSCPDAYPSDPSADGGVELRQTHISHLFMTADRVYKLHKAVTLPFLSFALRAERNADCLSEVELNRRLAPDVYLGVAPVLADERGGFRVGEPGEALVTPPGASAPAEHCIVMRRLAADRSALRLLESGGLLPRHVDALAGKLARFHCTARLGVPAPWSPEAWMARIEAPVANSFALAREHGGDLLEAERLDALEARMLDTLRRDRPRFLARRESGRAVEGHGDLHLDAVWIEADDAEPIAIDCLEFDPELRRIDAAAELAFFVMDAAYRGRDDLGERLLAAYAAAADDYGLYDVVDFHVLHRALVRAGVAAVAAHEREIDPGQREQAALSARRHVELMERWADRPRRPALLLTTGLPGAGKSTLAASAAEAIGAVVIASDRVRKHLAGLPIEALPDDAPRGALYSEASKSAVYEALLERAAPVLDSGRPVVLDATYSRRADRAAALAFAEDRRVPVLLLEAHCAEQTALERLERRLADPDRISDAGPDVYRAQRARYEPPDECKPDLRLVVRTDDSSWQESLSSRVTAWHEKESRR